jgi:hypothetical protein
MPALTPAFKQEVATPDFRLEMPGFGPAFKVEMPAAILGSPFLRLADLPSGWRTQDSGTPGPVTSTTCEGT